MLELNENLINKDDQASSEALGLSHLKMGFLLYKCGSFQKALPHLQKALPDLLKEGKLNAFFRCATRLLQMHYEMEEKEKWQDIEKEINKLCLAHNLPLSQRLLSVKAYYQIIENKMDEAKKNLDMALKVSFELMEKYEKEKDVIQQNEIRCDIMSCLYVYCLYYIYIKDQKSFNEELKNLKSLIKDFLDMKERVKVDITHIEDIQEWRVQNEVLEGMESEMERVEIIAMSLKLIEANHCIQFTGELDKANKLLWELYEEANKVNYTYIIPYIFIQLSHRYIELDDKIQSQTFLNLAKKHLSPERKQLKRHIDAIAEEDGLRSGKDMEEYDLIFDTKDHVLIDKDKGCVELKTQFVLMDLLKLFLLNPGVPYSKSDIILKIWGEKYHSKTHDNKLYVTIKRLKRDD